jgi:hypothetical protein
MSNLFEDKTEYNHNISNWDTSNVVNMSSMFKNAERFNIDISTWNINNVLDFTDMFENSKLETSISNTKRSAIHSSFSTNQYWPYQWSPENILVVDDTDAIGATIAAEAAAAFAAADGGIYIESTITAI